MRPRSTLKWLRLSLVFETLGLECQVLTRVQQGALKAAHKEKGKKGKPNETPALQVTEELPEASKREPSKKLREKRRKGGGALRRKGSRRNVLKRRASRVKAAEGTNGAPKKSSQKKAGMYACMVSMSLHVRESNFNAAFLQGPVKQTSEKNGDAKDSGQKKAGISMSLHFRESNFRLQGRVKHTSETLELKQLVCDINEEFFGACKVMMYWTRRAIGLSLFEYNGKNSWKQARLHSQPNSWPFSARCSIAETLPTTRTQSCSSSYRSECGLEFSFVVAWQAHLWCGGASLDDLWSSVAAHRAVLQGKGSARQSHELGKLLFDELGHRDS